MTSTAGTASALTINGVSWEHMPMEPSPRRTTGLIACAVGHSNELILTPLTDLGASILMALMHGEKSFAVLLDGSPDCRYGRGVKELSITQKMPPLLTSGDDPLHTGMTITPEEAKACRVWLERRRAKVRRT